MANLQSQMDKFHNKIRLRGFEDNQDLRDKRDKLIQALKDNINKDEKEPVLTFSKFDQGSYAMHTGIKPLHQADDYDIDVGIIFDLDPENHQKYIDDPVALKIRVKKALDHPWRNVAVRRPCVTVQYVKNGDNEYHVDLAIYRNSESQAGLLDLAKGKEASASEHRLWDTNDPKGLIDKIKNKYPSDQKDERDQMRRAIRYLKRWRDRQFSSGAPISIALTCAAYHWFAPRLDVVPGQSARKANDQAALLDLVNSILSRKYNNRIAIELPVYPYSDLLDGMTDSQMETFIQKLENLKKGLEESIDLICPHEAGKKLKRQFGDEFEVPEKEATGQKSAQVLAPTGVSA